MINLEKTTPATAITGEIASKSVLTISRVPMQTPGGGEIAVSPGIYREWVSLSQATTASGDNVQVVLGWPLQDFTTSAGAEVVYFERGCIVQRPDARCFAVYGSIYLHYRDLYDLRTGSGLDVGLPITEEQGVTGGRRSRFDNADIYWNAGMNATFEVHGAIRDKWYALGGYGGFLGYPISDEMSVKKNGAEIGRYNQFQGGTIYWSGSTGAFETHGAIRDLYQHTCNGPIGELGFPISDETPSPTGVRRYNNFQNGCIVWNATNGALAIYRSLEVFVSNINGSGSHTFFESIGTSQVWLYANCSVTTTAGFNDSFHLPPAGGDYGQPSAAPGIVATIPVVRGDMTAVVTLDGWDHCISTSDAHLGTLHATFNVENDFGVNHPQHIDDGDFHGDLDMRMQSIDNPNDPNFRRAEFWGFGNPSTPQLSRSQYAETFSDVESSESSMHWWNDFFYDQFYKGIAAGGNCFGMCVESIYAERNDSLFSEPIFSVTEPAAINEINVKHGYQLGAAYLDWYASNFLSLNFWDPIKVYHQSKAAWDSGDLPVICITDASISAGHCVRPCGPNAYTETATQYIIEVANPNDPGTDGTDPASRIVIDKANNTYSIAVVDGGSIWTGGHFSGGIMSWAPFSVLCSQPRTPFWEALALALGAALLIVGNGATTTQITDENGRTHYKPGLANGPARWDDTNLDARTRIPNLVRYPNSASFLSRGPAIDPVFRGYLARADRPELYRMVGLPSPFGPSPTQKEFVPLSPATNAQMQLVRSAAQTVYSTLSNGVGNAMRTTSPAEIVRPGGGVEPFLVGMPTTLAHQLNPTGSDSQYQWGFYSATSSVVATVSANGNTGDEMRVDRIGGVDQQVTLRPLGGGSRQAQFVLRCNAPQNANAVTFSLENVAVDAGSTFSANVLPDGKTLQVQNPGSAASISLTMQAGNGAPSAVKTLQIPAGKTATVSPADITNLPSSPVTVQVLGAPGGSVETTVTM